MIQKANAKELFEGYNLAGISVEEIQNSKKLYNYIVESAEIAKEQGKKFGDVIDEGIFGALVGSIAGATAGPAIMKGICKVLGIDINGTLGNLMTSRVVLAAICGELGLQF